MERSPEALKAALESVKQALHEEFTGNGAAARLDQFDAHMATCMMVIDHIFEESVRMEGYR